MDQKKHSLESLCTFYASRFFLKFFGFKSSLFFSRSSKDRKAEMPRVQSFGFDVQ
ncbi:hypothetical protein RND71_001090 [Anisodus tanguticus]|uniref:Uncharacterized protein n=1 Tax=Anisodus tanguticus TaxID=243964 RepID=A0AAE1SX76_9SOLA|nr:hypothetical protein RND71_001090 [Anisodus tanguticus]